MSSNSDKPLTLQWNQLTLEAIRYIRTSPFLTANVCAMENTVMYDRWTVYPKKFINTVAALNIKIIDEQNSTKKDKRNESDGFPCKLFSFFVNVVANKGF